MKASVEKAESVSRAVLAARKAWLTRRAKLGIVVEKEKKSDGKAVQVKQCEAGGVKKVRRIFRRKNSVVMSKDEEFREFLWGKNYRDEILENKACERCWRLKWCRAGVVVSAS